MRVCLVTPYAWDRPSEANDHWSALARALARRGHEVVILAPARKPALLMEGRRRLRALAQGDASALTPSPRVPLVVAVGLGVPVATGAAARSLPIPVAVAAGVRLALVRGRFDAVDVLDPDQPGPSAVALRETPTPVVATFFRGGPSLRRARGAERLAARADTVAAVSPAAADAVLQRFGLQATVTGVAVDRDRFSRTSATAPPLVAVEATLGDAGALRALFSELAPTTAEIALLRSAGSAALRSLVPSSLAGRVRLPDASTPAARAAALRGASMFIAARNGSPLIAREAAACGVPIIAVAGSPGSFGVEHEVSGLIAQEGQPALVAACAGRLLADEPLRARLAAAASPDGADAVAERVEALYSRAPRPRRPPAEPDAAPPILCDFHMHTDHSPDCETAVPDLIARALELGLGAIAVTDHNTIAGGLAAQAYVAERALPLHVVVGSEVMTATGEVIGLYLQEEIPRGMPFADTVEAIRAQGAIVYVPHPFDRLHSIPDAALLRRLADQIDVLETCNGRLYREAYNREAERFAERYDLLAGAGSDAHVPEGLATACVELPPFNDAESLLLALANGKIVRNPVNLVYLQGLKWLRSARSRTPGAES
jgi:predicted metal-dependent phosphoesterase TrpH